VLLVAGDLTKCGTPDEAAVLVDELSEVDVALHAIATKGGERIAYDDLAIAIGAHPQPTLPRGDVTREDLAALERQLRSEMRDAQTAARVPVGHPSATGTAAAAADLMRRVHAMIDETEKRQNRELALRIGEVLRDVNAQRQADLVRIDRSLGLVQNDLGVEVMKQRQSLNYLMRVNQR